MVEEKHILNKYFDNIYLLYIDDDELSKINPKLKKRNIEVEYFEGINGYKNVDRYNAYAKQFDSKHKNNLDARLLNYGSYGHILSFIKILKDTRQKKYKKILILEPDVYFSNNFEKECKKYLEMDYKMLYFGASQNKYYREETWDYIDENFSQELKKGFYYAYNTLGTFALALDSSIINNCLDMLLLMEAPTDVSFIKIQDTCRDKCIVSYPNIICCDLSKSKTSIKKNQVLSMKGLRWILKYDFIDTIVIKTEINSWYELTMNINSHLDNFKINITNNSDNNIFPKISKKINKHFFTNNKITLYFLSKSNSTKINIESIFLDNYSIKKIDKRYIKIKIPICIIKKMRDSEIGIYYMNNVFV